MDDLTLLIITTLPSLLTSHKGPGELSIPLGPFIYLLLARQRRKEILFRGLQINGNNVSLPVITVIGKNP